MGLKPSVAASSEEPFWRPQSYAAEICSVQRFGQKMLRKPCGNERPEKQPCTGHPRGMTFVLYIYILKVPPGETVFLGHGPRRGPCPNMGVVD